MIIKQIERPIRTLQSFSFILIFVLWRFHSENEQQGNNNINRSNQSPIQQGVGPVEIPLSPMEDREHNDVRKGIKDYALDDFTLIV